MTFKKRKADVEINQLDVHTIKSTSGLFFKGPFYTNHWRSIVKSNHGLAQTGESHIEDVQSILLDNDDVDTFNF